MPRSSRPVVSGPGIAISGTNSFSTSAKLKSDKDGQEASNSHEETFEEFTARYVDINWGGCCAVIAIARPAGFAGAIGRDFQLRGP